MYCTPANSWKMLPTATSPTPSHRYAGSGRTKYRPAEQTKTTAVLTPSQKVRRPARSARCPVTGARTAMTSPAIANPSPSVEDVSSLGPKLELVR